MLRSDCDNIVQTAMQLHGILIACVKAGDAEQLRRKRNEARYRILWLETLIVGHQVEEAIDWARRKVDVEEYEEGKERWMESRESLFRIEEDFSRGHYGEAQYEAATLAGYWRFIADTLPFRGASDRSG